MDQAAKRKIWNRNYYIRNREKRDLYNSEWTRKKRLDLICKLGGRCCFCGEKDPIVLDFDHINDDGAKHRRHRRVSLQETEKQIERFQLLCKNCNWRKEYWRRQSAKLKRKATSADAGGSAQPRVRKKGRDSSVSGEGLL